MKQNIRKSVFETNSSSTHSIVIAKSNEYKKFIPEGCVMFFGCGEFGWEEEVYHSTANKAKYLWTGIVTSGVFDFEAIKKIQQSIETILKKYDVWVCFTPFKVDKYTSQDGVEHEDYEFEGTNAYIDHPDELEPFLRALFPNNEVDEELLLNYLFNPYSYIHTSNDNDGTDSDGFYPEDVSVHGEVVEFYKGN